MERPDPKPLTEAQRDKLRAFGIDAEEPRLALRGLFSFPAVRIDARVHQYLLDEAGDQDADLTIAINRVLLRHVAAARNKKSSRKAG